MKIFEDVPRIDISKEMYDSCENYMELLQSTTEAGIFSSNGDARKMIQSGAISVNKSKIADAYDKIESTLLQDRFILVQRGKKNYFLMEVK